MNTDKADKTGIGDGAVRRLMVGVLSLLLLVAMPAAISSGAAYGSDEEPYATTTVSGDAATTTVSGDAATTTVAGDAATPVVEPEGERPRFTPQDDPVPNPDVRRTCSANIAFVLDHSFSMRSGDLEAIANAVVAMLKEFEGSGSYATVVQFDHNGRVLHPWAEVVDADDFKPVYQGDQGATFWNVAFNTIPPPPNANGGRVDLIIFMSDGDPASGHDGVAEANGYKNNGTHIFGLAYNYTGTTFFDAITDGTNSLHLDVAGLPAAGDEILGVDLITGANESTPGNLLAPIAKAVCDGDVTITKHVDGDVASGWTFASPDDPLRVDPGDGETGADGKVSFAWRLADPKSKSVSIDETSRTGYAFVGYRCDNGKSNMPDEPGWDPTNPKVAFVLNQQESVKCDYYNATAKYEVSLSKTATPAVVRKPGPVRYDFTITNTGNAQLTGVTLDDPLLVDEAIDWGTSTAPSSTPQGTLTAGASVQARGTYTVTQTMIDAGEDIPNTAKVTADHDASATADAKVTVEQTPGMSLTKTGALPDGTVRAGDRISYSFTVENTGNVTLTDVTVSDTVTGVTVRGGPIASLAPGKVDATTFSGEYTVTQAMIDAGTFHNTASATGTPPGAASTPVRAEAETDTPIPQKPSIEIVQTTPTPQVSPGDPVTFEITVTNPGNVTLTGVAVDDPSAPDCARTFPEALTPGESKTYTCTVGKVTESFVNVTGVKAQPPTPQGGEAPPAVTAKDDAEVVVVSNPGEISSRVFTDGNGNGKWDPGEPGIGGARVLLKDASGKVVATATTTADGGYRFDGLGAGRYTVVLGGKTVSGSLTTAASFTITLGEGQVFSEADFGLAPALPKTGFDVGPYTPAALWLLVAGTAVVAATRKRRHSSM